MRPLEVIQSFPQIVLVLLFVALLGPQLWLVTVLVALAWVPQVARMSRGLTLETIDKEYVEAAEAIGIPRHRILRNEILPNIVTPLTVEFAIRLTWSIGVIAALSFIGLGVQPPNSDWGLMINENRAGLLSVPWPVVVPACCIAIFTVGTNLCADGVARAAAQIEP
jgi:peptide/nickel transport system permease protein